MTHTNRPAKTGDIIEKIPSPHGSTVQDGTKLVVIDVLNGDDSAVVIDAEGNIETLWYPDQYKVVGNTAEKLKEMRKNFYVSKVVSDEDVKNFYKDRFGIDFKANKKNAVDDKGT